MGERRRVVVGVSGSLGSLAALHRGAEEARERGAELLAVLVWTPPGGEAGFRRAPCPPLLSAWRADAVERLTTALAEAFPIGPARVEMRALAMRGEPGSTLVALADGPQDVLVVGAGGRRWWRLRPSVSGHCVRRAGCPVLTVPRPPLQRELAVIERRNACHLPMERMEPMEPMEPIG
ncbi:universal stress protein [Kitasatospora sp. NBC_01287]|uniref:universal stress protein n=1 Tax=Kitasatospora sp. NBC_01287 TaxID=2903573 RepID=UPI0022554B8E|nr:universal stress protein [Kitasatospora sp. NBC_01287]MCX4748404.1 universal stress protein [Kitasatospora sp. NBC_01287]